MKLISLILTILITNQLFISALRHKQDLKKEAESKGIQKPLEVENSDVKEAKRQNGPVQDNEAKLPTITYGGLSRKDSVKDSKAEIKNTNNDKKEKKDDGENGPVADRKKSKDEGENGPVSDRKSAVKAETKTEEKIEEKKSEVISEKKEGVNKIEEKPVVNKIEEKKVEKKAEKVEKKVEVKVEEKKVEEIEKKVEVEEEKKVEVKPEEKKLEVKAVKEEKKETKPVERKAEEKSEKPKEELRKSEEKKLEIPTISQPTTLKTVSKTATHPKNIEPVIATKEKIKSDRTVETELLKKHGNEIQKNSGSAISSVGTVEAHDVTPNVKYPTLETKRALENPEIRASLLHRTVPNVVANENFPKNSSQPFNQYTKINQFVKYLRKDSPESKLNIPSSFQPVVMVKELSDAAKADLFLRNHRGYYKF